MSKKDRYSPIGGVWTRNTQLTGPQNQAIFDSHGDPIPMDNVGCFMRLMRFDAMVPGENEFYFGPTRLQDLAHYLARTANPNPQPGVDYTRMLGVNLYMQTNRLTSAADRIATPTAPAGTGPQAVPTSRLKITLPKTVLPWMRTVEISKDWEPTYQACIMPAPAPAPGALGSSLTPAQVGQLCQAGSIPLTVSAEYDDHGKLVGYKGKIQSDEVLQHDVDYAVVAVNGGRTLLEAWQSFTVAPPFFGYNPSTRTVTPADRPWVVKETPFSSCPR